MSSRDGLVRRKPGRPVFLGGAGALVLGLWAGPAGAQVLEARPQPEPAAAQASREQTRSLERDFFRNLLRDQAAIWTSPARARVEDLRWLVPLGAGTATFLATDRRSGDAVARHPSLVTPSLRIGDVLSPASMGGVALAFYVAGRLAHDDRARETGLLAGEALIGSLVAAAIVKGVTQRTRPDGGDERGDFFAGGTSFPSGHAAAAWSLAAVVAGEYRDRRIVQVVVYVMAGVVSASRFTGQRHYLSDVLVGSVIGYGVGRYVYALRHRVSAVAGSLDLRPARRWPIVVPTMDRSAGTYGAAVVWIY